MPNTKLDQFNQNGHCSSDSNYLKNTSTIHNSHLTTDSNQTELSSSPGGDWSSLTKEIIDTLPQVWTRGLLYLLAVFPMFGLPWAMLAKVDETGSARGRIESEGKTLGVDVPVGGTVTALKVKEGQTVKAGQVLLELDSELAKTELQQAQVKLEGQQNRVIQLEVMQNQLEIALRAQKLQNQAQQAAQLAQLEQSRQHLNFSRNAYGLVKERLTIDQTEVERYSHLRNEGAIPQVKVVEAERARTESQRLLNQAQSDIKQAQYKIDKQMSNYQNVVRAGQLALLESENRLKDLQSQISNAQSEIAQTKKQIQAFQFQLKQHILRSPTNGIIFQLGSVNVGSVIQTGQQIAKIARENAPLIFRANIPSYESGFLKVGLPVKLKFDAYAFQDYGVIPGHLRWISPDSKLVETPQGKIESFELEVSLAQTAILDRNKYITLTPGQTATAEVVVRQRRVIDFIIDPFKKLQKGDLKL